MSELQTISSGLSFSLFKRVMIPDRRWERRRWCWFSPCFVLGRRTFVLVQLHAWWGKRDQTCGAEGLTGCVNRVRLSLRADDYRPAQTQEWQVLSGAGTGWEIHVFVVCLDKTCSMCQGKPAPAYVTVTLRCHLVRPFRRDRWPCELVLFLTLLSGLHIRKRNSSAACKKELCERGSRGRPFPWPAGFLQGERQRTTYSVMTQRNYSEL